MESLRAGRIECENGDGRVDEAQGHPVLGELEGSKRQDVRSLSLPWARPGAAIALPRRTSLDASTDRVQRPSDSRPLPHTPGQGTLPALPASTPPIDRAQNEVPEYYEHTKLPIALDTIEVRPYISMSHNRPAREHALPQRANELLTLTLDLIQDSSTAVAIAKQRHFMRHHYQGT
jgi:hypothetical protein